MDQFDILAAALRTRLARLADSLYGCSHRRKSFPITMAAVPATAGQPAVPESTYVVCTQCGRHFAYDWASLDNTGKAVAARRPL